MSYKAATKAALPDPTWHEPMLYRLQRVKLMSKEIDLDEGYEWLKGDKVGYP